MTTLAALAAAGETAYELPMPSWLVGVLSLLAFAFLLGLTWSFRGTHHKYASPRKAQAEAADGHEARHAAPQGTHDEAHWPEHPGQH